MDIFKAYAVDENKELNGKWMPLGDAKLLVARAGNRKYVKMLGTEVELHQKALDVKDEAADALSDRIMVKVLANTILLGWENIKYDGAELEYSLENAVKLLSLKEFRREVMKMADDFNAFKLAQQEESEKN